MDLPDTSFELAAAFVNSTDSNIFLTGKAGTGKTTFLKKICAESLKNIAVVAPTGVAAVNAGGNTIHSFFGLPFQPLIPNREGKHDLLSRIKLSTEKKEIMQSLELLIIDEISMVRCDVLDAIDTILKAIRSNSHQPFGGVQVLMVGDMYQLPPVVKPLEWEHLRPFYASPYFFSSQVYLQYPPHFIELDIVHRQKDAAFIRLLNQVRNNDIDEEHYQLLHSRLLNEASPPPADLISLTTHTAKADAINKVEMEKLNTKTFTFHAKVEGVFQESNFPAEEKLYLKQGARVMFIKNDSERTRRYFNGKTGFVKSIEEDKIVVAVEEGNEITVQKEVWRNIIYKINRESGKLETEELGSFTQYPLKLAWAITIHKSQGLTFDRVLIDAGSAFAPGQVYVALSRCRTLESIFLSRRINSGALMTDPAIVAFAATQRSSSYISEKLKEENNAYLQKLMASLFRFQSFNSLLSMNRWICQHRTIEEQASGWFNEIHEKFRLIHDTANKFAVILEASDPFLPQIRERIKASSLYFLPLQEELLTMVSRCPVMLDNRTLATALNEKVNTVYQQLHYEKYLVSNMADGFSLNEYFRKKLEYKKPARPVNVYNTAGIKEAGSLRDELFNLLIAKRNELADSAGLPRYRIISTQSIQQMSDWMPVNAAQLDSISGFGKIKIRQYGDAFLEVISRFCEENELVPEFNIPPPRQEKKGKENKESSKNLTFDLFQQGKTISDIAKERKLSVGTIEGHIALFIESGKIKIEALVPDDKIHSIEKTMKKSKTASLSTLKNLLPDVTYGEIKMVIAHRKFESS